MSTCDCIGPLVARNCVGSVLLDLSPYYYYICPHTTSICVLTLVYVCACCCAQLCGQSTTMKHDYAALLCVSSYYCYVCPHTTAIRVLILLHVSPYYYICPHTSTICVLTLLDVWAEGCRMSGEVRADISACSAACSLCVLMLLLYVSSY